MAPHRQLLTDVATDNLALYEHQCLHSAASRILVLVVLLERPTSTDHPWWRKIGEREICQKHKIPTHTPNTKHQYPHTHTHQKQNPHTRISKQRRVHVCSKTKMPRTNFSPKKSTVSRAHEILHFRPETRPAQNSLCWASEACGPAHTGMDEICSATL